MTDEQLEKENTVMLGIMSEKVKELSKYFDSVQIFCTKNVLEIFLQDMVR